MCEIIIEGGETRGYSEEDIKRLLWYWLILLREPDRLTSEEVLLLERATAEAVGELDWKPCRSKT